MSVRLFSVFCVALLWAAPALQAGEFDERITLELLSGAEAAGSDREAAVLAEVTQFYWDRDMAPLWITAAGANGKARQLSAILSAAGEDALDPDDYEADAVRSLLAASDPALLAQLEVRLSMAMVQLAADLGEGRVTPQVADLELFVLRDGVHPSQVLTAAAAAEPGDLAALVGGYRPQTPRYTRLTEALADYRELAQGGGWAPIPGGPSLKPGMTDPRIGLLRERLRLWGDLAAKDDPAAAGGDPDFYDPALAAAVERMQYRHGLAVDGAVGPRTVTALNVPVEARIEQMVLNLERRRWMPDDLGQRYIFVNLADFTLKLVEEPKTVLAQRVVIGKTFQMTPIFSDEMTYLEINPYWHVPPSIARRSILPKVKRDVNYLADNKFTVFSDWSGDATVVDPKTVDWSQYTGHIPYKLRQGSGDGNALGRIKFMFPNRFSVYLHGTPARSLFEKSQRDFSSGCVRVEDPPSLAAAILSDQPDWPLDRIQETIDSEKRRVVTLPEPLPVHISYLTAWVNKDGQIHFRRDIYKRDHLLADALLGPRATRMNY